MIPADEIVVALSAALGQVVGTLAVFPLDVVKTRMQARSDCNEVQLSSALLRLLQEEGFGSLMRMFPTKAFSAFISRFTYYFLYQGIQNWYRKFLGVKVISFATSLFLGYLAGLLNTLFITPLEIITTKVMTDEDQRLTMRDVTVKLYGQGLPAFYFGWKCTFYNSWCPAVQNACYDRMRAAVLAVSHRSALSWVESFVIGAVAKATSTYITFPILRSKSLIYNMDSTKNAAAPSIFDVTFKTFADQGLGGLYQGLMPTLLKGVLQSAFMLMVKERLDVAVRAVAGIHARH